MANDKNKFGGGNPYSLYTPMSEDEQEAIQRLIDAGELEIHLSYPTPQGGMAGGVIRQFGRIILGDLKLHMAAWVEFASPEILIPIGFFDLELKTQSGILLFKERQAFPQMIMIGKGVGYEMLWDIAIQTIDPTIVKMLKPGATGLTTREGNRRLSTQDRELLETLRAGEKKVRQINKQDAHKASRTTAEQQKQAKEMAEKTISIQVT